MSRCGVLFVALEGWLLSECADAGDHRAVALSLVPRGRAAESAIQHGTLTL